MAFRMPNGEYNLINGRPHAACCNEKKPYNERCGVTVAKRDYWKRIAR